MSTSRWAVIGWRYGHVTVCSHLIGPLHTNTLQGGNLCDSDESCLYRCDEDGDGIVDGGLCKEPSML